MARVTAIGRETGGVGFIERSEKEKDVENARRT